MNRATLATLVVATLLVFAGCSAPGDQPTQTTTPRDGTAETPTTATTTATSNGTTDFPVGTDETGIANASLVVGTHESVLANASYAFVATQRAGDPGQEQIVTVRSNPDQRRVHAISEGSGQLGGTELYVNDTTVYVRRSVQGTSQYTVQDLGVNFTTQHRRQVGTGYIAAVLGAGTYEYAGSIEQTELEIYEFRMAEYEGGGPFPANATEFEGTVQIDERGVVRRADAVATTIEGESTAITAVAYRVLDVGTVSVDEPPWYEAARNATDAPTGNRTEATG